MMWKQATFMQQHVKGTEGPRVQFLLEHRILNTFDLLNNPHLDFKNSPTTIHLQLQPSLNSMYNYARPLMLC